LCKIPILNLTYQTADTKAQTWRYIVKIFNKFKSVTYKGTKYDFKYFCQFLPHNLKIVPNSALVALKLPGKLLAFSVVSASIFGNM